MKISVHLDHTDYPIYIEENILLNVLEYIGPAFKCKRIMIISDQNVYPLYGNLLFDALSLEYECSHFVLPAGEPTKHFQTLPLIYSALLNARITRSDLIIALGGGMIGDLAGFAAATFLRGINLIQIPTSLLAQVDSSIGGKVAVDLSEGKNMIGAFYHPSMVLIDPTVLRTLSPHFLTDGMGEVIKYGCIKDCTLFSTLESHHSFASLEKDLPTVIQRCIEIKKTIVEQDPFDTGQRMLLNFGHTLGHAIEHHYHYRRESHGEAVAIGMYQITRLAEAQHLTSPDISKRILNVLKTYGLPYNCGLLTTTLTHAISLDKKNLDNHLQLILLQDIGNAYIHPTNLQFFQQITERI